MSAGLSRGLIVAGHELTDAFRSRRALVLLVLFLLGSVGSTLLFIQVLHAIEVEVVTAMGLTPSDEPGGTTAVLWESDAFRDLVAALVGNHELADRLLSVPPVALFFGWLALTFTPLLVILLTSPRIAEDIGALTARFDLTRVDRATWCLGRMGGQAVMLAAALLLSAAGTWVTGWIRLNGFDPLPNAIAMAGLAGKAWLYAMAFAGLALGVSQISRSPVLATVYALLGYIVISTAAGFCVYFRTRGSYPLWTMIHDLTPNGHLRELWHPDPQHWGPAGLMLLVLSFTYFLAGYAILSRRDV